MTGCVVLLINSLRTGGAEQVCVTLANEFAHSGWRVELVVLNMRGARLQNQLAQGVEITDLGIRHARNSLLDIWRYISTHRPGVFLVFNHQLAVLLLALRLVSRADYRIVARNISTLSRQAAHESSLWHRWIVNGVVRLLYRRADRFIAQSQGMRQDLIRRYGVSPEKIEVIPNPLPRRFVQCDAPTAWPVRSEELLFVGRLHPSKGLDLMLRAVALCVRERAHLKLRLVGDGTEKPALRLLAATLKIADNVIFEGQVSDTLPFYGQARLTLLTSHYEGFPNVLLESLSQGTPVVAVDCESGPSEIIVGGVNGLLVTGREPGDLARAVLVALYTDWNVERVRGTAMAFSAQNIAGSYRAQLEKVGKTGQDREYS